MEFICQFLQPKILNVTIYELYRIFEMELQRLKNGETEFENSLIKIKVVGLITTIAFQKARLYALKLHRHLSFKFSEPEIIELLQFDWHEYLHKLQLVSDNILIKNFFKAMFICQIPTLPLFFSPTTEMRYRVKFLFN